MASLEYKFFLKIQKGKNPNSCWMWTAYTINSGYGLMRHKDKHILAHRASWIIHFGAIQEGLFVLHKCNNKKCVNPNHLYLGTQQDNIDYMIQCGNKPFGSNHANSKITEEDVLTIRKLYSEGNTASEISNIYPIKRKTINDIVQCKQWKHVTTSFSKTKNYNKGEKNSSSKLTAQQVLQIRSLGQKGYPYTRIGKKFNISGVNVKNIILRKTWKHI